MIHSILEAFVVKEIHSKQLGFTCLLFSPALVDMYLFIWLCLLSTTHLNKDILVLFSINCCWGFLFFFLFFFLRSAFFCENYTTLFSSCHFFFPFLCLFIYLLFVSYVLSPLFKICYISLSPFCSLLVESLNAWG